jgi:malonate transporter
MLYQVIEPLIPVAFVIVLGYLAGKRGKLSHADSLLITRLVLNWIFPALLLAGMATTPRAQLLDVRFIVATFIALMGMYAIAFAIGWARYRELKCSTLKGLVNGYPDGAFMGIPILASLFGPGSLYPILVLNVIASLIMIPLTTTLLAVASGKEGGAKAFAASVLEAVRRPLMWAPAIGILMSLLAIKLPPVVVDSLNLLGKATPGVSLLCLGLIMASVNMKLSLDVWENAALKLLLQPALMVGAVFMLSVSGVATQQMILLCALPSATISGMFANEAGAYRDEAATSILLSSTLSIVTFPFAIYLIERGVGAV